MKLPVVDRNSAPKLGGAKFIRLRQWLRLTCLVLCIIGLHLLAQARLSMQTGGQTTLALPSITEFLPKATTLRPIANTDLQEVLMAGGTRLALAATTSPHADSITGYSGPNNVLLVLDDRQQIKAAHLLSSGDTREHAEMVRESDAFWSQFQGLRWGDPRMLTLDGVSGATLTSLAIVEAVVLRTSGQQASLRFPRSVSIDEAQLLDKRIKRLAESERGGYPVWIAYAEGSELVGTVVRTGVWADAIEGYQGPTELLLLVDPQSVLSAMRMRRSYDNEPYVGYVKQEYSFWPLFTGKSLGELASLDFEQAGIEGVSGATMTSMAVAETVREVAGRYQAAQTDTAESSVSRAFWRWNWSLSEIATASVAWLSLFWSRSRVRGKRVPRLLWQGTCFIVLGLLTGNLLSLALLAGWTSGGSIRFELAPGLASLLAVALVYPLLFRGNVYCDHVCPHGALQQWMLSWQRQRRSAAVRPKTQPVPGRMQWLKLLLIATSLTSLGLAIAWLALDWRFPLAWLEPFDAYSLRLGFRRLSTSISTLVFVISLLIAWRWPMSYCRYACPTGRILDLVRSCRSKASLRFDGLLWLSTALICAAAFRTTV